MNNRIDITAEAINIAAIINETFHPSAGGIDMFIGTTRDETRTDGVSLIALDYEAYREMALGQMKSLVADAHARWPIVDYALVHRVGRVAVGEASVLIAVSCPHRSQAFEACRFLIDELKKSVTIWKREVWADESTSWGKTESSIGPADVSER